MAECVRKPVGAIASDLSGLAEEAGYSDDSAAKPISRKKKTTRKRRHALTHSNVVKELSEVNWRTLRYRILMLPSSQVRKIERMYASEEEHKNAGVMYWVDHHPYASWRRLITRLDRQGEHSLANRIHQYAEKVTDHSFTHQNISMVTATVDDDKLADNILHVPSSIWGEIIGKTLTSADFREEIIEYYIQYSPYATWDDLAGELYYRECGEALGVARRFIKRTPETTLNLPNLNTLLERVSHDWSGIGWRMNIPSSKRDEIRSQHSGDVQRCSRACWEVYLKEHPFPTWQRVAYSMYMQDHLEELEVVLKKYLKGSAENLRQFEEAMKHGHIRSWMWKLLLYGAAGSGKTSFKEMILGNPPPVYRTSTPLAMRPTTVYRINLDGKEFTKITTLQERRAFLARALLQSAPNLERRLLTTRPKVTSSSSNQPISTVAVSQVQTKDQASPDQGKPPPKDDQPPSVSLLEPASLDHGESDEDSECQVADILQSMSTDRELVTLMGQLSTTVNPLAFFRLLQMVDAGGQPQFHEILPVFLHNLSFYVFVFRLCDDLAKHPVIEFYIDGKPVGSPFTSAQSIEQLLQHCVRCIYSHRPPTGRESECPQIMVIGTHVDHEKKSGESRDEKNRKILQILSPLEEEQIIYHDPTAKKVVIPVNAKSPGDSERDIVDQVRQTLLSGGMVKPVDIPSRWFALEILLEEMAQALERGVLSKEDCITAAIEKLHFEKDAVDAALQYLDLVSAIMYYPKILPNVVFANPQVVLDKISELVFESVAPSKKISSGGWRKFCEHALVTEKFLSQDMFNSHYVAGLFEVKHLIKLFEKLLVFATFSATEYFVPALLHHLDSKAVDDHRVKCIPSLVLQFPGGGPRQGIFCALLCWLVSPENDSPAPWSISVDEQGSPECLFRNCIQLDLPNSPVAIILIDTYTHFEIHIDFPDDFCNDLRPKVYPKVKESIFKGLHKASLNLGYLNSTPSSSLLCPCGRGEAHVATANIDLDCWTCTQNRRRCGKLTPLQHLWLVDSSDTSGRAHSRILLESDLPMLFSKLRDYASKWRDIGLHLGFRSGELDNIQAKPFLQFGAPQSWLGAMLTEWLQRAPNDPRGSSSVESLTHALSKCEIGTIEL